MTALMSFTNAVPKAAMERHAVAAKVKLTRG